MSKVKQKKKRKSKKLNKKSAIIISVIAVALVIVTLLVSLLSLAPKNHPVYEFDKDVAKGIDVSYHNGDIDWKVVSKQVDFAFIRVGYRGYDSGGLVRDEKFDEYIKGANKNGLPVGVYFFSQAISEEEAVEEAKFVLKAVKDYDVSLPIMMDFEYGVDKHGNETGRLMNSNMSTGKATKIINAFCEQIEKGGYSAGIYSSKHFFKWVIDTPNIVDTAYIWLAEYHKEVSYDGEYNVWQYTNKGKCKGVSSKYVDYNYWYKK